MNNFNTCSVSPELLHDFLDPVLKKSCTHFNYMYLLWCNLIDIIPIGWVQLHITTLVKRRKYRTINHGNNDKLASACTTMKKDDFDR